MIKRVLVLSFLAVAVYLAVTVNLGEGTLWQHMQNVWDSDEMMELRDDVTRPWRASLVTPRSP